MATVINGTDNTAATPALTGTDTDTGVFFPAANTMAFSTGGTEKVRVDSAGNVGIGTVSPASKLEISGGTDNRLRINSTDGSTSNNYGIDFSTGSTVRAGIRYNAGNNYLAFYGFDNTARMLIDSGGGLSLRTAFPSNTTPFNIGVPGLYPVDRGIAVSNSAGAAIPFIAFTNSTTQAGYILTSGSTIAFVQGSDYRLKENVVSMNKSETLSKLMQVRPVNFNWKDGNTLHNYGFLAHELQETFPQAVHGEKDAVNEDGTIKTQSVNLTALIPYLVAAVQELKATVDAQAARIAALEAE